MKKLMSEVGSTFVTFYEATQQSARALRSQKMKWLLVRVPSDLRGIPYGDSAVVECISHSENELNGCPRSIRASWHSVWRRCNRRVLCALKIESIYVRSRFDLRDTLCCAVIECIAHSENEKNLFPSSSAMCRECLWIRTSNEIIFRVHSRTHRRSVVGYDVH